MMRILLVPVLVATFAAPAAAQLEGAFTLGTWDKDPDSRVQLNLVYNDGHSNYGRRVERSALFHFRHPSARRSRDRRTQRRRRRNRSASALLAVSRSRAPLGPPVPRCARPEG